MGWGGSSTTIGVLIQRLGAGDGAAHEAILACSRDRLAALTHQMLKGYPGVARWEATDDVLQNAMLRLDRALRAVPPRTTLDFLRLASTQIRRELIDLARRYAGPEGLGANHESRDIGGDRLPEGAGPSSDTHDPERLATWSEFHEAIDRLDADQGELFDLLWYQGLTQPEAAAVLGCSERTVHRRWVAARLRLAEALGGRFPV
jgi:RNA polymerase sigma factor (sigma-70 family)